MPGITELKLLIASMKPNLIEGEFVFCCVPPSMLTDYIHLKPIGMFHEKEGMTLILPIEAARQAGLPAEPAMRMISLDVHSSLEAVGLTAAFAMALGSEGISANVVAAYYHDHIFVPIADAERAMAALKALSAGQDRP
ncbi:MULTISPECIES: ACT domain-containing protein [unclassified Rhizobium]|uniref:ACT domain-containing protein n=1 Tax=unclassified Rhizobium TaxID=2613769 RepID=UPI000CDF3C42|nr:MULTISPECIES: ACT domain-containing protein [Rhizobium]AVA20548.1 ACT domain-containing protein [Rhizobium sp. NXC24]MDK4738746.1 ACT domain-containing protein [Rhizobium sp. CNPSo 3464]UWU21827.1 ACT domain-containing protein [Rhizobium tropici]